MGGGGGTIAARQVAKPTPDGYTFLFAGPGHAAAPFLQKQPAYDPIKDFIPVTLVTRFPLVMVINPNVPAKNLGEFIALAKAEPGKRTFGSSGVGGSSHIPAEALPSAAGVQMTHVPFRGNGPSSAALLGGQIDMIVDGLAPQLGNIAEGRVRVLGVTTAERTPFLPDAPAVSEALPGYQFPMWVALFAPAKTPKAIVERLAAEVGKAMQDPVTQEALRRRQGRSGRLEPRRIRHVLPRTAQVQRGRHQERAAFSRTSHAHAVRDRILTTHCGSLPRPPQLSDMLLRQEAGERSTRRSSQREAAAAVAAVLDAQIKAGIDIVSDGEQPRVGFSTVPAAADGRLRRRIHPADAARSRRLPTCSPSGCGRCA